MKEIQPKILFGVIFLSVCVCLSAVYRAVDKDEKVNTTVNLNDCGPQALLFLLSELNIQADLNKIKIIAQTDSEGTTLYGLKKAAEAYGLRASGMRLTYLELRSYLQKGNRVIAFVNSDHYVTIKKLHPDGIVYKDLAPGFQFADENEWKQMWFEQGSEQGVVLVIGGF